MKVNLGPNFKMPKTIKMMLANILDPHERGARKRAYIEAVHFANETAKALEKKTKNGNQSSET